MKEWSPIKSLEGAEAESSFRRAILVWRAIGKASFQIYRCLLSFLRASLSNWLAVRDQMTGASRTVKVVVPRALEINWTVEEIKADPSSLWRERGSPNLGMISCKSFFATSEAFLSGLGRPQSTQ